MSYEVQVRIAAEHILQYGGGNLTHQNVNAVKVTDANSLVLEGNGTTVVYSHGAWTSFTSKEIADETPKQNLDLGADKVPDQTAPDLPTEEGLDKVTSILKDAKLEPKDEDAAPPKGSPGAA